MYICICTYDIHIQIEKEGEKNGDIYLKELLIYLKKRVIMEVASPKSPG